MRSGLYEGQMMHRRHEHPATGNVAHNFGYRVALPYLFLDELDAVAGMHPLWSSHRPNAVWFRRSDYLGDPAVPLDETVRDAAERQLGRRPKGPIAMLAHLRTWGWSFNPIALYYCFGESGKEVDALVIEVTSTPWLERHVYAVDGAVGRHRFPKAMHVSPFMGMDHDYVLDWSLPTETLSVHLGNRVGDDRLFDASMTLRRHELSKETLGRLVWHHPQPPYRGTAAIYRQAIALARRGAPFHARSKPAQPARVPILTHERSTANG